MSSKPSDLKRSAPSSLGLSISYQLTSAYHLCINSDHSFLPNADIGNARGIFFNSSPHYATFNRAQALKITSPQMPLFFACI